MFPGTAMMYWLGLRDLWRMRSAEEAARGGAFSAKAFHDELLSFGSIPVPLAAKLFAHSRAEARDQRAEAKDQRPEAKS
jgi:uncharacterized protein (DUF885 family)